MGSALSAAEKSSPDSGAVLKRRAGRAPATLRITGYSETGRVPGALSHCGRRLREDARGELAADGGLAEDLQLPILTLSGPASPPSGMGHSTVWRNMHVTTQFLRIRVGQLSRSGRHRAVPPGRRSTYVGIHPPKCSLGTAECASIRGPIGAPLRRRTHRILDEEMRQLRPHRQRPDRTEPGGQESIPGQPSLPGNRQDFRAVQGLRD
jgi:hypothetical protein